MESKASASNFSLSTTKSKPVQVQVDGSRDGEMRIVEGDILTVDDSARIQTAHNLSQRATLGVAQSVWTVTNNRKAIERHLRLNFRKFDHVLDDFFEVRQFKSVGLKAEVASCAPRDVVCCKNLPQLIDFIKEIELPILI
ncbi:hypothetical protein QAD02_021697 [Eretmocerus hayati]|uniref:Uncharacterized protein n=1 Tax=Eretmocerus hayati TaxID=131215 RepID=A0ACC2PRG3_9HYME|nr:hypothetical protein QAD02_021697 [Eretmocerus hayati]